MHSWQRCTQHILFTVIWHQTYGKGPLRQQERKPTTWRLITFCIIKEKFIYLDPTYKKKHVFDVIPLTKIRYGFGKGKEKHLLSYFQQNQNFSVNQFCKMRLIKAKMYSNNPDYLVMLKYNFSGGDLWRKSNRSNFTNANIGCCAEVVLFCQETNSCYLYELKKTWYRNLPPTDTNIHEAKNNQSCWRDIQRKNKYFLSETTFLSFILHSHITHYIT